MTTPANTRATYADLMAVPDHKVAELIHGELFVSPRPAIPHAFAASRLGSVLLPPFSREGGDGPGGWVILYEPELHLGGDVLVPDLAGWRRARWTHTMSDAAFVTVPPDWLCEVVSPSTERLDRARKMAVYGAAQVPYVWLVNPIAKMIEIYRAGASGGWVLLGVWTEAARVRLEPFEAIEFDLDELWMR
jgi:Uma2 family endonuclease